MTLSSCARASSVPRASSSCSHSSSSSRSRREKNTNRSLTKRYNFNASSFSENLRNSAARPIIFLDIDGVLNRTATAPQLIVERDKVVILNEICASTGAEVVLTTYWRHFEEYISYIFMRHDCLEIDVVGATDGKPHLADSVHHDLHVSTNRIQEIKRYLDMRFGENDNEKKYPKFVIVDDKQVVNKGHEWSNRFVRTKSNIGLTNERAQRMIESLERV